MKWPCEDQQWESLRCWGATRAACGPAKARTGTELVAAAAWSELALWSILASHWARPDGDNLEWDLRKIL